MTTNTKTLTKSNQNVAEEVCRLHSEIETARAEAIMAAKMSLPKAIRIGELLAGQKEKLKHGEWLPWLDANVPFTERTAQNYLRLFDRRDELKNETVSYLGEAYRLLTDSKTDGDLDKIESRIEKHLPGLDEARTALIEIRDNQHWRERFKSFSDFISTIDKNYADFLLSVYEIELSQITLDPKIHARANGIEPELVSQYAEAMRNGADFPPIDIFDTERGMVCADGHHRVNAAIRAGFKTIRATIHKGNFKDCVRFAIGSNVTHGVRRPIRES